MVAYDNLGLETIDKRCKTLLVGDAGAPFTVAADPSKAWVKQALRVFDIATNQARALRKRELIDDYKTGAHFGAYWGITTDIVDYQLADALPVDAGVRPLPVMYSDPAESVFRGRAVPPDQSRVRAV